jgi:hypothetical protein
MSALAEQLITRHGGICFYGIAPPKAHTSSDRLKSIAVQQASRFQNMQIDGLIVYDIQDEAERTAKPRPFPFLPTIDPATYAYDYLAAYHIPKVLYRCVSNDSSDSLVQWLSNIRSFDANPIVVFVGAPSRHSRVGISLEQACTLARHHNPEVILGGVAIAERHNESVNEHERILRKTAQGCRFVVTQAVYDATSTKSLLSDYSISVEGNGSDPIPIILTFSPCGSDTTLNFMKWLGIHFPRWLENEIRHAKDPLETSVDLCEELFADIMDYAVSHDLPVGINVESVSIRKAEIDASVELFLRLQRRAQGCT